jgi:hypothetical protein
MRLSVPSALFDGLQADQLRRGYVDEFTTRLDAVWLHTDMGPSWYLTREGAVFEHDAFENGEPRELDPPMLWAALVCGAKTLSRPELLTLLPSKPDGAAICRRCHGSHWADLGGDVSEPHEPLIVVCTSCLGLGWTE